MLLVHFAALFLIYVRFYSTYFIKDYKINDFIFNSQNKKVEKLLRSNVTLEPAMTKSEKMLFYKYLSRGKNYFEIGSGGSTAQAAIRNLNIISVESDSSWHEKLQGILKGYDNVKYITIDLHSRNNWGSPGKDTTYNDWIKYSRSYKKEYNSDIILIDGRFRVACALNVFDKIDRSVTVIIHDFMNRPQYHKVLEYYEIIEKVDSIVILKKKDVSPPPKDLIEKYEHIKA